MYFDGRFFDRQRVQVLLLSEIESKGAVTSPLLPLNIDYVVHVDVNQSLRVVSGQTFPSQTSSLLLSGLDQLWRGEYFNLKGAAAPRLAGDYTNRFVQRVEETLQPRRFRRVAAHVPKHRNLRPEAFGVVGTAA